MRAGPEATAGTGSGRRAWAQACSRTGYHPVAPWTERKLTGNKWNGVPTAALPQPMRCPDSKIGPEQARKMRALAARMRAYAAQTSEELFRQKFQAVAAELDEAA